MNRFIVGITGASGGVYAVRLLEELLSRGCEVHLVPSGNGRRVLEFETGTSLDAVAERLGKLPGTLETHDNRDLFAPVASGSFKASGMAVLPCSMATLGEIASGSSKSLIGRAADVCLKERRKLVLVPRETPLSSVHLRNMLTLSEAGAVLLPAMPAFYHRPETIGALVDFIVGRALDALGLDNALCPPWGQAIK